MNHSEARDDFCNSFEARKTSFEIMSAIAEIANDINQAERIFNDPDEREIEEILNIINDYPHKYTWGVFGTDWAEGL